MDNNLNLKSKVVLSNKVEMPIIGFGVYKIQDGEEVLEAVKSAFSAGYRMVDTASRYNNEKGVGQALVSYGLMREEVFITTKLWNADQGYDNTLKAIDASLERLGVSYVDLYLVHWPSASEDKTESLNKREETWRAMEEIYNSGKAKAIGVSNFTITHLEEMKKYANTMPMVNQVEFHPFLFQKDLLEYCRANNIVLEAHTPLVKGTKMLDAHIVTIAKKYNKSPAQLLLRWGIQHGAVVLPKSLNPDRIKENINIFDFEIAPEDMEKLDSLNNNERQAWDPTNIK